MVRSTEAEGKSRSAEGMLTVKNLVAVFILNVLGGTRRKLISPATYTDMFDDNFIILGQIFFRNIPVIS
jgi:hypothetical protein